MSAPNGTRPPKVAIVLFNLGGPDSLAAVRPFLMNLFTDPAILRVPFFIRPFLARIIARARVKPARENYALLGGASPLLELTRRQASALTAALPEIEVQSFIAMRYWHPFSRAAARAVKAWNPDHVLLLPLYPQFSTTTTGSSLTAWREAAAQVGLVKPVTTLCCWHTDPAYLAAIAAQVRTRYDQARVEQGAGAKVRVLFSAHGLPETIVRAGDPYQAQIETTVGGVVAALGIPELDHVVCYQSRATPQQWLQPSTEAELARAGRDGAAVVVVPIAFVSDHSETLVELDVEYAAVARKDGVRGYYRVPAPNDDPAFIVALADIVRRALARGPGLCSDAGGRVCADPHGACPFARAAIAREWAA